MRRSWGHPLLVLYVAPNDTEATRLGISVGKRVGKAVVRNQVKRRVREAVRHRYADVRPGHDLVFIARAPAATATWPDLRDAAIDLLRRARVLSPHAAPSSQ
jgi:ribonuclease P protein component